MIGSVVSWTPLAADYTRFSRTRRGAAFGAGLGYFVPTIWCIGLGILIVLARGVVATRRRCRPPSPRPAASRSSRSLAITIDESEKAFADIYSTAVSIQNLLPRVSQRLLITLVSVVATGLALALNLGNYQNFLYLLGSFFVPLFGVLVADWLAARRALRAGARSSTGPAWRPAQLVAWLVGFGLYQWLSPVGPALVDEARRAHAPAQRQLHRLAAELRRRVRLARSSRALYALARPVRRSPSSGISRVTSIAGGAPRIGGAPWHAARALRGARRGRASSSRSAASAEAIDFRRGSRRSASPFALVVGGETTAFSFSYDEAGARTMTRRRARRAVARARSCGVARRRVAARRAAPARRLRRSDARALGAAHDPRSTARGSCARAAAGPLLLDGDFDRDAAPRTCRC